MDYLFLQAFALIKSQGPVVGGLALSLILAIMGVRGAWGFFNKILEKRDLERAQMIGVLQSQVQQMNGVISSYDKRMSDFLGRTTKVQAGILHTQRQLADGIKEGRSEAATAHLELANGLSALSNSLASLAGEVKGAL